MKNEGKQFEESIQKSVPKYALIYRIPDAAQSFYQSDKLRFSKKNPFDFILWDSKRRLLYALELKTVKGKSISFERCKDDTGEIHWHQIQGLMDWSKYNGIICGFIIEFRELEKTIFLPIHSIVSILSSIDKKSFRILDLDNLNISYYEVPQHKVRTRFRYGIDDMLCNIADSKEREIRYED